MNKIFFLCIAMFASVTSCNKKSESSTLVQYQVTATNSTKIDITYNNIIGNKVMVSVKDFWAFDVPNPSKPFTAFVEASSSSPFSSISTTCIVNILVNNTVVKTDTVSSNTIATAQIAYILQ